MKKKFMYIVKVLKVVDFFDKSKPQKMYEMYCSG